MLLVKGVHNSHDAVSIT